MAGITPFKKKGRTTRRNAELDSSSVHVLLSESGCGCFLVKQSSDCVDKTPRVLTFQFFSSSWSFAPLFASVHFLEGSPNDGLVLLRHMPSPGSSGAPVCLEGEKLLLLLGAEDHLWGSGEVPAL